jgi:hypothetical protein
VHTHPNAQQNVVRPWLSLQLLLRIDCGSYCVDRSLKRRTKAVTAGREDEPSVGRDR